ncbi:rab-GTPase-TBC domain-containing protein [Dichotomocladium elegans]|nr:rab-GTPase-TBC domain-containing protein [Dichotomocladium elegans]
MAFLRQPSVMERACQSGLRSVCWKIYLQYFTTLQAVSSWPAAQAELRQKYIDLKRKYIEEPTEKMMKKGESDEDLNDNNPLALGDDNPWQQHFEDSEIRKVIRQDVDRTFPDVDFFRSTEVQEKMTDILFIYCKIHADVSYRQGMHELLAPLYWVLATEKVSATDRLITQLFDPFFVEHDAHILFDKLMRSAKPWYELNERIASANIPKVSANSVSTEKTIRVNTVVLSCQRIHHEYLKATDPVLYEHLERFGIEPQLYGMRWLRLLFGREFEFHELLKLWDAIFGLDPSLKIAEFICLAILFRMRDRLLASDYAECLTLLMRCPQVGNPASLVEQAHYLQNDLSEGGGLHILQQNDLKSGKPARHSLLDGVDNPQLNQPAIAAANRIAHRRSHGANLDGLASITRGVMKSPQVRDLNKAIAGVMGTVQKNVNMFSNAAIDSQPSRRRLTISSEFPDNIDQQVTRTYQTSRSQISPHPISSGAQQQYMPDGRRMSQEGAALAKLKMTNRRMGDLLAKCVDILETELFVNGTDESSSGTTEDETKVAGKKPNEAMLVNALAGIKHIRDVLSEKQEIFDPSVMNVTSNNPNNAAGNDDNPSLKDWDVVDYHEDKATIDGAAAATKNQRDPETKPLPPVQNEQKSSPLQENLPSLGVMPAVPIMETTPSAEAEQAKTSSVSGGQLHSRLSPSSPPVSQSPTRMSPKPHIVYRIEDLLSDPALQKETGKHSNKFNWMLQSEDACNRDIDKSSSERTSQTSRTASPRKRASFYYRQSSGTAVNNVDPLGAKSSDN